MKNARYIIPNAITLLNIVAGACSIVFTMEDYVWLPVYCLIAAAVFDMLDGLTAKLLKATSEFGKQMDSLADVVSFGLAPAIIMYKILIMVFVSKGDGTFLIEESTWGQRLILFTALNLVVFSSLRLARFNVTEQKGTDFTGLPVPASALFVVAIWIVIHGDISPEHLTRILNFYSILAVIGVLSLLMVSNIPMLSLKFSGLGLQNNIWRYVLIIGAIILFIVFGLPALLYIMLYYLLLSFLKVLITSAFKE